jgi:acetylornithine deacetylase/succinyl-diaminopimelate desuccinylase-like protein
MPGTLFAPYRTVITPTIVAGGSGPSMVPSICDAKIDIRLIPAVGREVVEAAIREIAEGVARRRPPLRVDVAVETIIPPTEIAPDEPVVRAARAAARALLGFDPPLTVSGPANESYLLNGFGIPTCIIGPEGGNAHAADEYVVVDSLVRAAEVYARIAADLA